MNVMEMGDVEKRGSSYGDERDSVIDGRWYYPSMSDL